MGRDRFGAAGTAASLLTNVELSTGATSSILLESNLEKADALPVEEALALSLQGTVSVCPDAFIRLCHHCFELFANLFPPFGSRLRI